MALEPRAVVLLQGRESMKRRTTWTAGAAGALMLALIACGGADKMREPTLIAADGIYSCKEVRSSRILVIVDAGGTQPSAAVPTASQKEHLLGFLKHLPPPTKSAIKSNVNTNFDLQMDDIDKETPSSLSNQEFAALTTAYAPQYSAQSSEIHTIEDKELRRRAALLCSCRSESQRSSSSASGTWSDGLLVSGIIGAAAGGVLASLSSVADPGSQAQVNTRDVGLVLTGTGAAAAAVGAALKLGDRSASVASAAADQEVAAAILLNDSAGAAAWSRAYTVCVTAEAASALSRASETTTVAAFGEPDAGSSPAADAGGDSATSSEGPDDSAARSLDSKAGVDAGAPVRTGGKPK